MQLQRQLLEKENLTNYIKFVQEYTRLIAKRDHENNPTWMQVQATKVDAFEQKALLLKRLNGVHNVLVDYLANEATPDFKNLVADVYEAIVGMLDGSKRDFIGRDSIFINSEIQQKMIAVWGTFKFDVPELQGQAFLPHWRGEGAVDYSPGQLFLVKHASHFMFNVLKFEEMKRNGSEITAEEFAQYLVPVFFLPIGCLDFSKDAAQCETGLISLDYKTRTVVNV